MGQEKECRTSGCWLLWVTGETCWDSRGEEQEWAWWTTKWMASKGLADSWESGIMGRAGWIVVLVIFAVLSIVVLLSLWLLACQHTKRPIHKQLLHCNHHWFHCHHCCHCRFHCPHCCQCDSKPDLPVLGIVVVKCTREADFKASLSALPLLVASSPTLLSSSTLSLLSLPSLLLWACVAPGWEREKSRLVSTKHNPT